MSWLNILNINLQLMRPECTGPFGVYEKLSIALTFPIGFVALLGIYVAIQYALSKRMATEQFKAKHYGLGAIAHLSRQVLTAMVAAFLVGSTFFLRSVLVVWDCTLPETNGGPTFVRVEPRIECSANNVEYSTLLYMASTGVVAYVCTLGVIAFGLTIKRDLFQFIGDKFEDAYFYWELVLLSRKVLIMMSFLFFAAIPEQAWFLGSTVVIVSLLLHSATRPYEDALIDWCELLSLLSTLFIFQSGVVFKVLNDPSNPNTGDQARATSDALERISILLLLINIVLAAVTEARVWQHMRHDDEDYRVRMIKRRREELKHQDDSLLQALASATTLANERAAHRAAGGSKDMAATFENPLGDGDADDDDEESTRGKKPSQK